MNFFIKLTLIISILLTVGCSSLPAEKGPSMDEVFNTGSTGGTPAGALKTLKNSIKQEYSRVGDAPVMPLVRPAIIMPIWIPERVTSRGTLKGGHWIYETMEDGGFIE